MTTQGTQATPPPAGFWKIRYLVIGFGALVVLVMLMLRACGSDETEQADRHGGDMPRQAIVVQIPASQWPQQQAPVQAPAPPQPGYGYMPQQSVPPPAPVVDGSNPWSVQVPRPYDSGQVGGVQQQWGRPQQQRAPQYVPQPSGGSVYRPLEESSSARTAPRPVAPPPVQSYRPMAPYDRLSGSSFGEGTPPPAYPYGGAYPGYYGQGAYGVPVAPYYPGGVPGAGLPGVW